MNQSQQSVNLLFHSLLNANVRELGTEHIIERKGIKVLTYNFFLRPDPIKNNESDYKDERLEDFRSKFQDFDIICFQELFSSFNKRKEKMKKYALESGLFYSCESPCPSFFSKFLIDGGLLILSRFPIIESEFKPYDHGALADSIVAKGVLYAKIQVKDQCLAVFNTHFQASYFDTSEAQWHFTIKTRIRQGEQLINFIYNRINQLDKAERSRTTFLLMGDFNIDYYDNEEQRKKGHIPKSTVDEYLAFKTKLNMLGSAIDLNKNKFRDKVPFTFGVNDEEHDHVLTYKAEHNCNQTLDYVWEIKPNFSLPLFDSREAAGSIVFEDESHLSPLKVNYDSFHVEEFLIKNRPYQQLSDHFGLSFELDDY